MAQAFDFSGMVAAAAGNSTPYAYQKAIARDGLPEVLRVPTGTGKTMAMVLGWLYRRRFHPDAGVRNSTPPRLVFTLPMRVLVEQTRDVVIGWLDALGLAEAIPVHLLMGGEEAGKSEWRLDPERDCIVVGTLDMVLSRALNRAYGTSQWLWPIDFGLINNGCHFVFDEVQLMGPGLPTSRQLQSLREILGCSFPCASTWMSATVDLDDLATVDRPRIATVIELEDVDRAGALATRLGGLKTVQQLSVESSRYEKSLAAAIRAHHREGTLTVAVLNVVDRAVKVAAELRHIEGAADVVLVHSRFRPIDRARHLKAALAPVDGQGIGRIVISTQVLEAGVDISADTLITEAAPWPSIVQRAGRCNRDGLAPAAWLLWVEPPKALPYPDADVAASASALMGLEGQAVTPERMAREPVRVTPETHAVLRRRDLLDLFDTTPDLTGNDIDVARFIRTADDMDTDVAWRVLEGDAWKKEERQPARNERCPVPVAALRKFANDHQGGVWRYDHVAERWVGCRGQDVRPGSSVLVRASTGGYTAEAGWSPESKGAVSVVAPEGEGEDGDGDDAIGADPGTFAPRRWVGLADHLAHVEEALRRMLDSVTRTLPPAHRDAALRAAALHDVAKAHPAFQDMLARSAGSDADRARAHAVGPPWAKSSQERRASNHRRHFRHELAGALALLGGWRAAVDDLTEHDLAIYLVAAHHGRVRLGVRALPDEAAGRVLGVEDGDILPALPSIGLPECAIRLSWLNLGTSDGEPSWSARMLALRNRPDLGPFRMGLLEALVRLADWKATAAEAEL